ncbi:hypothetical protein AGMMS49974_09770 [Deltaproteobacteria bacterium]|nr:hypothetical protein AGMMS49974_09770 [Deltaproteobacteria bacterium]GHU99925.1 hypothetical protein AGMMS50248_08800 [Deltaproteobacteria bacterium]
MFGPDVRQKTHTAEIDAQQWNGASGKASHHAEHGAVAAKHDDKKKVIRLICRTVATGVNHGGGMPPAAQPAKYFKTKKGSAFMPCLADKEHAAA